MHTRPCLAIAVLWLALLAQAVAQTRLDKPQLVSTEWLASRLNDPNLRIVDARGSMPAYLQEHIPNAIFLHVETLRLSRGGVPGQLMPAERLAEIFGGMGISPDHEVVVYSSTEDAFASATYVALALISIGHQRVGVLDGGFEKWKAENRPLTNKIPQFEPRAYPPRPDTSLFRTLEWIKQHLDSPESVQLLDARAPQQYQAGHIPTAQNLFLREMLRPEGNISVWRNPDEIQAKLKQLGIDPQRTIVTYCNTGREASQLWFTLRYVLGIEAYLYDGSWVEWSAKGMPVER